MTRVVHNHPDECVQLLEFEHTNGGREEFFQGVLETEVPKGINDCSVIAVSLAYGRLILNPIMPNHDYGLALFGLRTFNRSIRPWERRNFHEGKLEFSIRRIRQVAADYLTTGVPKHRNPIYGIDTNVYAAYLEKICAYTLVFGEPCPVERFCLCQASGDLVLDGFFTETGVYDGRYGHVTAIQDQIVRGPTPISNGYFHVVHVWQRI